MLKKLGMRSLVVPFTPFADAEICPYNEYQRRCHVESSDMEEEASVVMDFVHGKDMQELAQELLRKARRGGSARGVDILFGAYHIINFPVISREWLQRA